MVSPIPRKFPDIKLVWSEGGIGWITAAIERAACKALFEGIPQEEIDMITHRNAGALRLSHIRGAGRPQPGELMPPVTPAPLTGLRNLDCSHTTAGQRATILLADYGAEIVWVERPGGDPLLGGMAGGDSAHRSRHARSC